MSAASKDPEETPEVEPTAEALSEDAGDAESSESSTDESLENTEAGEEEGSDEESPDSESVRVQATNEEASTDGASEDTADTPESSEKATAESSPDGNGSPSEEDLPERRQTGRKGVRLNRLIASKIVDGDCQRECYLHLVDISKGGFRVNSDDPFPEGREFTLEVGLAAFGNELATKKPKQIFPVRLVWSKSLLGGMVVSGLAFNNLDDEGKEVVAAIMQGASPEGRRMHFRLNRVLGVEMGGSQESEPTEDETEAEPRWLYPLTLDLSVEGMRICLSEELEVGSKFPIKIFLEFDLPTVKAEAEVMWQEVMPSGRVQVGLRFTGLSERDAAAIKTYIDQCLQQDDAHRNL